MQINLSKEVLREEVKINLSKAGFDTNKLAAKVAFILDESGSMSHLYNNGTVQAILDKLLAVSYYFDDDGDIDMFAFSNKGRQLPQANQDDHGTYKFKPNYGGTYYAEVVTQVEDFYYGGSKVVKKAGIFGKMFGAKDKVVTTEAEGRSDSGDTHPVYIFFLTDGDTLNAAQDERVLNNFLHEHKDAYIQFIGLGDAQFSAVNRIVSQNKGNSSLIRVSDIDSEGDQLLSKLINADVKAIIQQ